MSTPAPSLAPAARVFDAVVLLPTYNERLNLPKIIPAILAAAQVDIMVLDDGSPDGTGALADALAKDEPRLQVVHRPKKVGLGAAYLDGFVRALAAGYEQVVQMDADFSHPVATLPKMLELGQSVDLVLGSRWVPGGGTVNWPWQRQLISRCGSLYARTLLRLQVRDITGGFKCFRRRVLLGIDLQKIVTSGYGFQIEITYRALRAGFSWTEIPITFVERQLGDSKMSRAIVWEAILQVPRLPWRLKRQAPAPVAAP